MTVKIIGYGVVGKNMHKIFPKAFIHDPIIGFNYKEKTDVAFVCVPTEKLTDGSADTSIVLKVIKENDADIFCIKSTVPPGTTREIKNITGKNVIFSPEYFGGTEHANYHKYNFVILGGERKLCSKVCEAFKLVSHPETIFRFTDSKSAELVKYMENTWLATKVTFCNEFRRIADLAGIDYNELRELWLLDPRINRSHTFVYDDHPYYDSHCLNKDIPAIIAFCEKIGYNPSLLKQVFDTNSVFKEVYHGNI